MNLEEGSKIPTFNLPTSSGKKIKLSEIKSENVVIYFYPKDDTPGCTNQAKDFSKLKAKFSKKNTEIIGISPDSMEKHKKFIDKSNWYIHHMNLESLDVRESVSFISEFLDLKEGKWTAPKNKGDFSIDPRELSINFL